MQKTDQSLWKIYNEVEEIKNKSDKLDNLEDNLRELFSKYEINRVIYCLKKLFPENRSILLEQQEKQEQQALITIRKDEKFKYQVKMRYPGCIICSPGLCSILCTEVAHIWDFSKCDATSKYNPDNGVVMCANAHKLFDSGWIKLEPCESGHLSGMIKIYIDNVLKNTELYKYNGNIITLSPESIPFLYKRYQ